MGKIRWFVFGRAELVVLLLAILGIGIVVSLWAFLPPRQTNTPTNKSETRLRSDIGNKSAKANDEHRSSTRNIRRDTMERSADYVGAPTRETYVPKEKYASGTVVDLNRADSVALLKVPGIGPAFAGRIVRYRERLGGYYTVLQLQEVFGMDYERYLALKKWFVVHRPPHSVRLDTVHYGSLPRHPYLSWKQRAAIDRILRRDGHLSGWAQLLRLPEFAVEDSIRLSHYFTFYPPRLDALLNRY